MGDLTFLMHRDLGTNAFYGLAKQYFTAAGATVVEAPAAGQTLEGVFQELAKTKTEQKVVNLVCHAIGFAAMLCPISNAARQARQVMMTVDDLQDALAKKSIAPPGPGVVTAKTRVVIYGCDIGRQLKYLELLSGLFGDPGAILAPRRMSVFQLAGDKVVYRQAQTWTVLRKASIIPAGMTAPKDGWPKFRDAFVTDAVDKFSGVAMGTSTLALEELTRKLTTVASNATTKLGPTFFIEEGIAIVPAPGQTAAAAAASVAPKTNGDPVTTKVTSFDQADDTTVVTKATSADTYPVDAAKTVFAITAVILAKVIDAPVAIAEGDGYRLVTSSKARAPSQGPPPTGASSSTGGGAPPPSAFADQLRALLDELLADGVPQADIDAALAAIPRGDGTNEIVTEVADAPPIPDDIGSLSLPPREVV